MIKDILIPYALVNGKIKHIEDITHKDEAFCIECGEQLVLRNGEVNTKHLAHKPSSSCIYRDYTNIQKHSIESYEHKYAKQYLKDNLKYFRSFNDRIIAKNGEFKLGGFTDLRIDNIELECRTLQKELNLSQAYIPDLLIRTPDRLIALEIYKSNRKDKDKLKEILNGSDIHVYEVDINEISKVSIKALFSKMKLIYSKIKIAYDDTLAKIHETIISLSNTKEYHKKNAEKLRAENIGLNIDIDNLHTAIRNHNEKHKHNQEEIIRLNKIVAELKGSNPLGLINNYKRLIEELSKEKDNLISKHKTEKEHFDRTLKEVEDKLLETTAQLNKAENKDILWRLEMQKNRIIDLLELDEERKKQIKLLSDKINELTN